MSHFYFNPLQMNDLGFQPFMQPNLHPFYLYSQNPNYSIPYSQSISQFSNLFFAPDSKEFCNHQRFLNTFEHELPQNRSKENCHHFPDKNIVQESIIKNEETQEKNDKSSKSRPQVVKSSKKKSEQKPLKKKRVKKVTKKEKKEKQMRRNSVQNSKRNIIPNQIHQILSILFKRKKSSQMVEKLLNRYRYQSDQVQLSVNRFYLYQSLLKEKVNHYANENSLRQLLLPLEPRCSIYSLEEQSVYCRIGLTLIFHFIRNDAQIHILNSQRIKSTNRVQHMRCKRYLQQFLKNLIRQKKNKQKIQTVSIKQQAIQE